MAIAKAARVAPVTTFEADELTAELLASTRAVLVTDFSLRVLIWQHPSWDGNTDAPALLVRVPDLKPKRVAPIRAHIKKLGFGEGLVPPGPMGV